MDDVSFQVDSEGMVVDRNGLTDAKKEITESIIKFVVFWLKFFLT